jgi:murein DD-endopeptidase MepM/ murein hydrolase activator NlpD
MATSLPTEGQSTPHASSETLVVPRRRSRRVLFALRNPQCALRNPQRRPRPRESGERGEGERFVASSIAALEGHEMRRSLGLSAIPAVLALAAAGCDDGGHWVLQPFDGGEEDGGGGETVDDGVGPEADAGPDADGEAGPDADADVPAEAEAEAGADADADVGDPCDWVRIVDLGGEPLNVRAGPTRGDAVIGSLSEGAMVEVLGTATGDTITDSTLGRSSDQWYRIPFGGGEGYITSIYTECTAEPPPALGWVYPTTGTDSLSPWSITCGLGCSWSTYLGHLAEDYSTGGSDLGAPLYAVADGTVAYVYHDVGNYLDIVVVRHDLPAPTSAGDTVLYSRYGHTVAGVSAGAAVRAGDRVGEIGDVTPYGFGIHLHFEIVNEAAQHDGPFCRGCEASSIWMGPGYAGYDFADGAEFHEVSDSITGNRFYAPSRVIDTDGRL